MSRYTAIDMRLAAEDLTIEGLNWMANRGALADAAEMLRQAADALEREDERETKFEYAVLWDYDNSLFVKSMDYSYVKQKMDEANADGPACHLVRRSVGEWKEMK